MARLPVHAAIGAIQSTLFFRSGLAPGRLEELLDAMAHGCLGIGPAPAVPPDSQPWGPPRPLRRHPHLLTRARAHEAVLVGWARARRPG